MKQCPTPHCDGVLRKDNSFFSPPLDNQGMATPMGPGHDSPRPLKPWVLRPWTLRPSGLLWAPLGPWALGPGGPGPRASWAQAPRALGSEALGTVLGDVPKGAVWNLRSPSLTRPDGETIFRSLTLHLKASGVRLGRGLPEKPMAEFRLWAQALRPLGPRALDPSALGPRVVIFCEFQTKEFRDAPNRIPGLPP